MVAGLWSADLTPRKYLSVSAYVQRISKLKIRYLRTHLKMKYVSLEGTNDFRLFSLAEGRQPGGQV